MASALTFELRRADGTPADPPRLTTVAPLWRPGDTIPIGRRTLRVVEVREGSAEHPTVLVVEDTSDHHGRPAQEPNMRDIPPAVPRQHGCSGLITAP
jgi:hypothetical protein